MHIPIPSKYKTILSPIADIEYYFVGGFVRDSIMHLKAKDIDIIVFVPLKEIEKRFKTKAFIINERFNTARFIIGGMNFDFNTAEYNLKKDIMRRDFTVNAIAADKKGIIRPLSDITFRDDPVRMLRAYRFSEKLNMRFSRGLNSMVRKNADKINSVANERVGAEMNLIFNHKDTAILLQKMYKNGLLIALFPALKKTEHYWHRKFGTRKLINHLFSVCTNIDSVLNTVTIRNMKIYGKKYIFELYMAALFHDIEKPSMEHMRKGKLSFARHDIESAKTASFILRNQLKLSNDSVQRVEKLIRMHMRPHLLVEASSVKRRGFYRLMRDAGDDIEGLFILCIADKIASDGIWDKRYIQLYRKVVNIKKAIKVKRINFVNGNDIMKTLGLKPSPLIGKLIEEGNDYAISHNISDKAKILAYLKTLKSQ